MSGWVKYRIRYLRNWRQYIKLLAKSIEELLPNAEVYVIGGAAEDRLTILSDIDVLIVVDEPLTTQQLRKIKADIIWNAEKYGFPWDYPVEIHIITRNELPQHLKHVKKLIPVKTRSHELSL